MRLSSTVRGNVRAFSLAVWDFYKHDLNACVRVQVDTSHFPAPAPCAGGVASVGLTRKSAPHIR